MRFYMKRYLEKLKEQENVLSDKEKNHRKLKLRSNLILEDLRNISLIEDTENMDNEISYDFSDEELDIIKEMADKYNISLQDAMAVAYIEAVLFEKKERLEEEDPDIFVIDIYELVINHRYTYEIPEDKEIMIITLYDIKEEIEVLII